MNVNERIGANFKEARAARGLALGAVAVRSGIPEARLAKIESGEVAVSADEVIRLEDVLKMKPGEFRRGARWDQDLLRMAVEFLRPRR